MKSKLVEVDSCRINTFDFPNPIDPSLSPITVELPFGTYRYTVNYGSDLIIRLICVTSKGEKVIEFDPRKVKEKILGELEAKRQRDAARSAAFDQLDRPDCWL